MNDIARQKPARALLCGAVALLLAACSHVTAMKPTRGNQKFWYRAPQDLIQGELSMSAVILDRTEDSLTLRPKSEWGKFKYKMVRTEADTNDNKSVPLSDMKAGKLRMVRQLEFSDVKAEPEETYHFHGTIHKVKNGGRTVIATFPFGGEDITFRMELLESEPSGPTPPPTIRNMYYGPHVRNNIDFYKAESDEPTPLVVFIHGGGWGAFDKVNVWSVQPYLDRGISVASVNYRLIYDAEKDGVEPPVQACLHDAARGIQFLRHKAEDLNIDKRRMGAYGGSAGACTSLWIAFHDDLADPDSDDPVARESTRLYCAGGVGPQTNLDPRENREWIGPGFQYGAHAFGIDGKDKRDAFEKFLARRSELMDLIHEYSPIDHITPDDPPIYIDCPRPNITPVPVGGLEGHKGLATHHPMFGIKVKEKMDELGMECYLHYKGKEAEEYGSLDRFFFDKLRN